MSVSEIRVKFLVFFSVSKVWSTLCMYMIILNLFYDIKWKEGNYSRKIWFENLNLESENYRLGGKHLTHIWFSKMHKMTKIFLRLLRWIDRKFSRKPPERNMGSWLCTRKALLMEQLRVNFLVFSTQLHPILRNLEIKLLI